MILKLEAARNPVRPQVCTWGNDICECKSSSITKDIVPAPLAKPVGTVESQSAFSNSDRLAGMVTQICHWSQANYFETGWHCIRADVSHSVISFSFLHIIPQNATPVCIRHVRFGLILANKDESIYAYHLLPSMDESGHLASIHLPIWVVSAVYLAPLYVQDFLACYVALCKISVFKPFQESIKPAVLNHPQVVRLLRTWKMFQFTKAQDWIGKELWYDKLTGCNSRLSAQMSGTKSELR